MKHIRIVVAILALTVWSSVSADEPEPVDANVVKIAVSRAGEITLNGREATINEVRAAFAKLAESKGVVWYYREGAEEEEPHPNAMLVIRAIVDAKLPVSLSTKPDFSDVVLPDGTTRPR
jgi:hypothetical protein